MICLYFLKKVQTVAAKLLRVFIITRSHVCVPFCNLRKGPRICKPKILHFFWNSQQKGFNMKPNENVQSAKYQNGVF